MGNQERGEEMKTDYKKLVLGSAGKKKVDLFRKKRGKWSSKSDDNWLKRVGNRAKVF